MELVANLTERVNTSQCISAYFHASKDVNLRGTLTRVEKSSACFTPTEKIKVIDMSHRDIVVHTLLNNANRALTADDIDKMNCTLEIEGGTIFKIALY